MKFVLEWITLFHSQFHSINHVQSVRLWAHSWLAAMLCYHTISLYFAFMLELFCVCPTKFVLIIHGFSVCWKIPVLVAYLTITRSILNTRWNLGIGLWWWGLESAKSVFYSHVTLMRKRTHLSICGLLKYIYLKKKFKKKGNKQPHLKQFGALICSFTSTLQKSLDVAFVLVLLICF